MAPVEIYAFPGQKGRERVTHDPWSPGRFVLKIHQIGRLENKLRHTLLVLSWLSPLPPSLVLTVVVLWFDGGNMIQ